MMMMGGGDRWGMMEKKNINPCFIRSLSGQNLTRLPMEGELSVGETSVEG